MSTSTMDIHEELTKLKPMLTMTSAKIDRWTGDEKQSILRESQAQGQALEDAKRGMSTNIWQCHYQWSSVWSHVGISEWFEWTAVPISVYYFICQTCSPTPSMYLAQEVVCGMLPGLKGSVPLYFRTETGSHFCIPQSAVSDQSLSFQIRKPFKRKHQDGWTCLSSQKHWLCGVCNWAAKSC